MLPTVSHRLVEDVDTLPKKLGLGGECETVAVRQLDDHVPPLGFLMQVVRSEMSMTSALRLIGTATNGPLRETWILPYDFTPANSIALPIHRPLPWIG